MNLREAKDGKDLPEKDAILACILAVLRLVGFSQSRKTTIDLLMSVITMLDTALVFKYSWPYK